jgi:MFS family permease
MPTLSTQRTAHALRHFTLSGALWSIYGPNATPAAALFSGYALSVGITEAQIAFLVGLSALVGLWELFAFPVSHFLARHRRLMVGMGAIEITAASAVILVGLIAPHLRFAVMAVLLLIAYAIGHTNSPPFNSWLSNVLPEEVRGRYIGGRMFIISITAMVYIAVASAWLDWQHKTYGAFAAMFVIGWIAGILGYLLLLNTPYPNTEEEPRESIWHSLALPLRNRPFVLLMAYFGCWTAASSMAGAFYGVYMINQLKLSYGTIAIFTNLTLAMMMVGYLAAGNITQRYGSKPLTQLLIIPVAAVPLMWAFATPDTYRWVVPIACVINGFAISGLGVSASNLLYKLLPRGEGNSVYFAMWAAALAVGAALGPFAGGLLKDTLPATISVGTLDFSALQTIFLIAAAAHVLPVILSAVLVEGEATSPRYLLGQFRGNLLYMAFSYGLYAMARKDETRGDALRRLGRAGSPLAVDRLVRGLDHVSPQVRKGAVKGLGEGRFPEAVQPLVDELEDKESDVRAEAAEALGKIGAGHGPLFEALHDDDPRVRQSAAVGLSQLQTEEAREALLQALQDEPDRVLFPTLVEAVARGEDLRGVAPALDGLARLTAPVVRMHVINGICQIIGEKNHFYRLATADELAEGRMREKMMARIRRLLSRVRCVGRDERAAFRELGIAVERALDGDRLEEFAGASRELAVLVESLPEAPEVARYAALAIRLYLDQERPPHSEHELIVFLIICLTSLSRNVSG